jgi:hypothetical protein
MLVVALILWRDVRTSEGTVTSGRLSSLLAAPAPSLQAIREAFRQQDQPLTLRWIALGALVTPCSSRRWPRRSPSCSSWC